MSGCTQPRQAVDLAPLIAQARAAKRGSLDAAVEAVHAWYGPMWGISYDGAGYTAELHARPPFVGRHADPAVALILALLRALQTPDLEEQSQ